MCLYMFTETDFILTDQLKITQNFEIVKNE